MLLDAGRIEAGALNQLIDVVGAVIPGVADGERWVNLTFEIDDDDPNAGFDSPLFSFLAARGPSSPFVTIMAARSGTRSSAAQIGVQHRAGQKAAEQLTEAGVDLPEGWRWVQDHPRRGLVVEIHEPTTAEVAATWIASVMDQTNRAPITGAVLYEVFDES